MNNIELCITVHYDNHLIPPANNRFNKIKYDVPLI